MSYSSSRSHSQSQSHSHSHSASAPRVGPIPAASSSGWSDKYPVVSEDQRSPDASSGLIPGASPQYQQPSPGYSQKAQTSQQSQHHEPARDDSAKEIYVEGLAPPARRQNPWGLSPVAFGAIIAVITAVVVGGAVGGGIAGSVSSVCPDYHSGSSNAYTTTITAAAGGSGTTASATSASVLPEPSSVQNYAALEPYYVDNLQNPSCTQNDETIDGPFNTSFTLFCGLDIGNSYPDETHSSLVVADFVGLFAYSLEDCIYACANTWHFMDQWDPDQGNGNIPVCKGVTWRNNLAESNSTLSANCWLKNGTSTGESCNICYSAKLFNREGSAL